MESAIERIDATYAYDAPTYSIAIASMSSRSVVFSEVGDPQPSTTTTIGFFTRDPIGYRDGGSLYRSYFVLAKMDPSGLGFIGGGTPIDPQPSPLDPPTMIPIGNPPIWVPGPIQFPTNPPPMWLLIPWHHSVCDSLVGGAGGCSSCTRSECENFLNQIDIAIAEVPFYVYWGRNTCQGFVFSFEEHFYDNFPGNHPPGNCFSYEIVHWNTGAYPATGHAAIKFTNCAGLVFYVDNWWLSGSPFNPGHYFQPHNIPSIYF